MWVERPAPTDVSGIRNLRKCSRNERGAGPKVAISTGDGHGGFSDVTSAPGFPGYPQGSAHCGTVQQIDRSSHLLREAQSELSADYAPLVGPTLEFLSCGVSHRFDLVAIKVANKCAIVVGIVILPNTGNPFVDAAVRQGGRVKAFYRLCDPAPEKLRERHFRRLPAARLWEFQC